MNDNKKTIPNCPLCDTTMVNIVYGEPNLLLFEQAENRKIFLGGCIVMDTNPVYHCYTCQRGFTADLKTSTHQNDDWIRGDYCE